MAVRTWCIVRVKLGPTRLVRGVDFPPKWVFYLQKRHRACHEKQICKVTSAQNSASVTPPQIAQSPTESGLRQSLFRVPSGFEAIRFGLDHEKKSDLFSQFIGLDESDIVLRRLSPTDLMGA